MCLCCECTYITSALSFQAQHSTILAKTKEESRDRIEKLEKIAKDKTEEVSIGGWG